MKSPHFFFFIFIPCLLGLEAVRDVGLRKDEGLAVVTSCEASPRLSELAVYWLNGAELQADESVGRP